jgi:hypothetical protein
MTTLAESSVADLRKSRYWKIRRRRGRLVYTFKGEDAYEIKTSTVQDAGNGLFMLQDVPPRTAFTVYTGTDLGSATTETYEQDWYLPFRSSREGGYMLSIRNRLIGGYNGFTGAQFINDSRGGIGRNMTTLERVAAGLQKQRPPYNARINGAGAIESLGKPIMVGTEVLMDYGQEYWTWEKNRPKREHLEIIKSTGVNHRGISS